MSIWTKTFEKFNTIPTQKLEIKEGRTPLDWFKLEEQTVYVKREDLNPNNSFKDRSMIYMFSHYLSQGNKKFVISSSGNAAVSSAMIAHKAKVELNIFLSKKTPQKKIERIEEAISNYPKIKIHFSQKAKSSAIKFATETHSVNLRGSTDDIALIGYKSIAYELYDENPNIDAIFVPTSSATGALGIYLGYKEITDKIPQIHIVQNQRIHPIAKEFDKDFNFVESSIVDCINDKVAKRKKGIVDVINKTNGFGWVVSDKEILQAIEKTKQLELDNQSPNSHLATAGMIKALNNNHKFSSPCLIFSGY